MIIIILHKMREMEREMAYQEKIITANFYYSFFHSSFFPNPNR